MSDLVNWIKTHKLTTVLLLIVGYFALIIFRNASGLGSTTNLAIPRLNEYKSGSPLDSSIGAPAGRIVAPGSGVGSIGIFPQPYERVSENPDRIVIQESSLSLLVKNVRQTGDEIISYAKGLGGFMVNASYSNPSESPYSQITVRVPTDKLDEALNHFRSLAIKVTNENLVGTDVTEQYEDLDAQLATLKSTKAKLEEIMERAVTVQEILEVQTQLINNQQQIDAVTGAKLALADNARLTRVTIYLSTDELSLPYTPDKVFRPDVVFKLAVRSLVGTLQWLAESLIWIVVFGVLWVPIVAAFILFKNWKKRHSPPTQPR